MMICVHLREDGVGKFQLCSVGLEHSYLTASTLHLLPSVLGSIPAVLSLSHIFKVFVPEV